jgi:hypothetical protein
MDIRRIVQLKRKQRIEKMKEKFDTCPDKLLKYPSIIDNINIIKTNIEKDITDLESTPELLLPNKFEYKFVSTDPAVCELFSKNSTFIHDWNLFLKNTDDPIIEPSYLINEIIIYFIKSLGMSVMEYPFFSCTAINNIVHPWERFRLKRSASVEFILTIFLNRM